MVLEVKTINSGEITYVCFLCLLAIIIVLGNCLLIYILITRQQFRNITNFYVISLSVADLLVGVFVITSISLSILQVDMGGNWCTISPILELFAFTAGIFTIIVVSVDRYRAVVKAVGYKPNVRSVCISLVIVWVGSFIYSLRILVQSEVTKLFNKDSGAENNTTLSEDEQESHVFCNVLDETDYHDVIFRAVDFCLLFIIPIIVISVMYYRIIKCLWSINATSAQSTQKKKTLVKILITTILAFFLCWLPFYLCDIISDSVEFVAIESGEKSADDEEEENVVLEKLRWFLIMFALSHSAIHPLIYAFFNIGFRHEISLMFDQMKVFCKCRNSSIYPTEQQPSGSQQNSSDLARTQKNSGNNRDHVEPYLTRMQKTVETPETTLKSI